MLHRRRWLRPAKIDDPGDWLAKRLILPIIIGLVLYLIVTRVLAGERMRCEAEPTGSDWHYRTKVDGRETKCWFPGERMKPRSELFWGRPDPVPQTTARPEEQASESAPLLGAALVVKHSFMACPSVTYEAVLDLDAAKLRCRKVLAGERIVIEEQQGQLLCVRSLRLAECVWIDEGVLKP